MSDIETRLARLESVVEDQQDRLETQQHRIEDQQSTITTQQEIIDAQRERIAALEVDGSLGSMSRRGALAAGGALGLLGLGVGTASASPSGQVGTAGRPLESVHAQRINFAEVDDSFTNIRSNDNGDSLKFSLGTYEETVLSLNRSDSGAPNVVAGTNSIKKDVSGVTIGGGEENMIEESGNFATIGGGAGNVAKGRLSSIPGGSSNEAEGKYSFAAGHKAKAKHDGTFVVGDSDTDSSIESTHEDQARFQMNVGASAFELISKPYDGDDDPDDDLEDGEAVIYLSNNGDNPELAFAFKDASADDEGVVTKTIAFEDDE